MEKKDIKGVLYWITGLSGAGKTTIGNELYYRLKKLQDNVVILDGDILKKIVGGKIGYSDAERHERAWMYARLCKSLTDQGMIVICCTIAMYDDVRQWNRDNNKAYVEVFLDVPIATLIQRDQKGIYSGANSGKISDVAGIDLQVQMPKTPDVVIKNDGSIGVKSCADMILSHKVIQSKDFMRDTDYWNAYYDKGIREIIQPSKFAVDIADRLVTGRSILDLGCGNGRDSIFFANKGLIVTAIDASDGIIGKLQDEYRDNENLRFLCDDFVCSSALFVGQYDYCYSRFTLHAINDAQQKELLKNVYNVLKSGGEFYIEVRSIHDPIYGMGEKVGENAYKYNGHYRRFLNIDNLVDECKEVGFNVVYAEESTGFAPFGDDDPPVIRVILSR